MTAPKKTYWISWMNRTRYKDEKGKLVIKTTPRYSEEPIARAEFDRITKLGYAARMWEANLVLMDCINFSNNCKMEKAYVDHDRHVVVENDRYTLRLKEDEIRKLLIRKEQAEAALNKINEDLAKLQGA